MSGTEIAYNSSCLRAFYAVSSTDIVYGARVCYEEGGRCGQGDAYEGTLSAYALAMRCPDGLKAVLEKAGTEVATPLASYALATPCPVLTWADMLCDVRYCHRLSYPRYLTRMQIVPSTDMSCTMPSTEIAYAATLRLCDARGLGGTVPLPPYACAMQCPVLAYAVEFGTSGTVLRNVQYCAMHVLREVRYSRAE
eukprot:1060170-Rhodomonas_salina.1